MSTGSSLHRALPWIGGGGLVAGILAGLLVPIYTDEVGWRAQLARSPFDGGVDRELGDQCGANTTLAAPWFMQPLRHVSASLDTAFADPRLVRIGGTAVALLAVALLVAIARRAHGNGARMPLVYAFGLLGLGTMPFVLVLSRPEHPILIALAVAVLLAVRPPASARAAQATVLAILALAALMLGAHAKAVVFVPILMVAALLAGRGRDALALRIGVALVTALLTAEAFVYWRTRLACPGDAVIAAHNAAENVSAAGGGWTAALHAFLRHLWPTHYFTGISPGDPQMSDWLPVSGWRDAATVATMQLLSVLWYFALVGLAAGVAYAAGDAYRRRRLDRRAVLAAVILACVLGWSGLQVNKNVYEATLVLPLLAIALVLVLPALVARWPRLMAGTAVGLTGIALASEALLFLTYLPPLARTARAPGHIAGQRFSFTPWGYPAMRADIVAAGRLCGIRATDARYLLVDDLTYWPFLRSYRPFNRMAVFESWIPTSRDPLGYLRAHGSSGIVAQCAILPPDLRANAKAQGQFCCLGPL